MPDRRTPSWLAGLALLGAAACGDVADEGRATRVSLTAEQPTAGIDEPVTFRYEAEGQNLLGIVVRFGDGARDSIQAFGAQSAAGSTTHTYESAGLFDASAEAIEYSGRKATDSLRIEVSASARDH